MEEKERKRETMTGLAIGETKAVFHENVTARPCRNKRKWLLHSAFDTRQRESEEPSSLFAKDNEILKDHKSSPKSKRLDHSMNQLSGGGSGIGFTGDSPFVKRLVFFLVNFHLALLWNDVQIGLRPAASQKENRLEC